MKTLRLTKKSRTVKKYGAWTEILHTREYTHDLGFVLYNVTSELFNDRRKRFMCYWTDGYGIVGNLKYCMREKCTRHIPR